jgi:hypothetical protein
MHLYSYIWVVQLVPRLNLAFVSPRISRGIGKVLVCLSPYGFDNPSNTLRRKLLQLASVFLRIILLGLRTANSVYTKAYMWKTTLGWGRTRPDFLALLWIVATPGALLACVCRVVRFIPLQCWLLIRISATPSDMGDGLFTTFKHRIINFIILWW